MFSIRPKKLQNKEMFNFTERAVIKISCQKTFEFLQKKSKKEALNENEQLALSTLEGVIKKVDIIN